MISETDHSAAEQARRCLLGELLGDELTTLARELAVSWLHHDGCSDVEIARRTRMSTYTAARIRARLRLAVNPARSSEVASRGA